MTEFLKELCRYSREDINRIIDKTAKPPKLIRVVYRDIPANTPQSSSLKK